MREWTVEEEVLLQSLYQQGYRVEDIARHLGRTVKSVYQKANKLGIGRFRSLGEPPNTTLPEPITNLTGNFAVTSDWHIPYYDQKLADEFLNICQKRKVRKLIIGGDFLNLDAISTFLSRRYDLNEELKQAEKVLRVLSWFFKEVYLVPGNHDFRLARKLDVPLSFAYVVRMFCDSGNVHTTDYDYVEFVSGGKLWRVCHPKNYSQIKGRVATKIAEKYGRNVVSAHGHFFCVTKAGPRGYFCVDSGGMFDMRKIEYFHRTNTYPDWDQGFVLIIDGFPEPYTVDKETGKVVRV